MSGTRKVFVFDLETNPMLYGNIYPKVMFIPHLR